jgi:hypothetical protein
MREIYKQKKTTNGSENNNEEEATAVRQNQAVRMAERKKTI